MNRRRAFGALLAVVALLGTSRAAADDAADHAALVELTKVYQSAIQKGDPDALAPYLAEDFTGVMVTGEEVATLESLNAYWAKIQGYLGKGGTYAVKVNVAEPAKIVGDLAYARGTTNDVAVTSDGKEYQFRGFWTAICRRKGDAWKIVRIHGSMDAITNTFVAAALQKASTYSGLVGGVLGFFMGALVLWFFSRRAKPVSPTV
jgi:ketosteroid isomerase-like protein